MGLGIFSKEHNDIRDHPDASTETAIAGAAALGHPIGATGIWLLPLVIAVTSYLVSLAGSLSFH